MKTKLLVLTLLLLPSLQSLAHRDGCHTQHSCPSDSGSYVCGDKGHCSECPDNEYCLSRAPRSELALKLNPKANPVQTPASPKILALRTVTRVIDGDTLVLDGGEKLRLIGVDTPETVDPRKPVQHFGKEASAFTRKLAEGKKVRLEGYKKNADKYQRSLAYVFLEDGTLLNAEIIKQGYGFAYTKYPFQRMEEFRKYEREARESQKGLWKN